MPGSTVCQDGDVASVEEATDWLATTGWQFEDHRPLAGLQSVVVARAV